MWAKTLKTSIHILCCLQGIRPTSHLHGSNYTIQEHIWRSIYLMARLAQQWMKEQGIIFDALGPRSIFSGLSGSLGGWLKGALYSVFCILPLHVQPKEKEHKYTNPQSDNSPSCLQVCTSQCFPNSGNSAMLNFAWWPCVLEPMLFLVSSTNALEKTHMTLNDSTNFWMSLKKNSICALNYSHFMGVTSCFV